jgi:hypothetical protein
VPGDSIVDRVFEQGLKDAEAVIVVVSASSVVKPWVREELNAGVVKKIEGHCKLIPVIIDDCSIPEALKTTVWQTIRDLENYDAELDRIVWAILDDRSRPLVGATPAYAALRPIEDSSPRTRMS